MYRDSNGLIVQADGDQGDTAGRTGDFWFHRGLSGASTVDHLEFMRLLTLLQVSPGVFVRHPDHYNDPNDFSRDQTVPLILAMGAMEEYDSLRQLLKQQIKRYTLYQNNDLATPQDWGYYIRALRVWYLYPVLLVGDLFMLTNSLIRCINGSDDNTSDDVNHTLALLQAQYSYPTPISWLSRKIYKWFRRGGIQNAWDQYFKPSSGANPFNKLYEYKIDNM